MVYSFVQSVVLVRWFFVQSYKSEKKRDFLLQKVSESDIIVSVEGKAIRKTSGLPTVVFIG